MLTQAHFNKLNCFENIKVDNDKENYESIDDIIQDDKQFLFDFFYNQPYYREFMHKIKKADRGTIFYRGLIRKGVKYQSAFFKAILKSIKDIKSNSEPKIERPKSKKKVGTYRLPKIKELRIKKKKIENINLKKNELLQLEREKYEKYTQEIKKLFPGLTKSSNFSLKIPKMTTSSSSNNIFSPFSQTIDYINDSFYKNGNLTGKISRNSFVTPYNNKSTYYRSNSLNNNSFRNKSFLKSINLTKRYKDKNDLRSLVNNCMEEIVNGKEVKGNVPKYGKNIIKKIKKNLNANNIVFKDQKVIEEKVKKNKYTKLEKINYENIKKKINQKISTTLAYRSRKELIKLLKINKNTPSYILHLNEINKRNKRVGEKRIIGRNEIRKVESLCNLGFTKNAKLNDKIDKINSKNRQLNKLGKIKHSISFNDFYSTKKEKNILKGTLVPNLIKLNDMGSQKMTFEDAISRIIKK